MLTHQQRLYAESRKDGLGKRAAAIAAGCPEATASQAASRYEKDQKVQEHMRRIGFEPVTKSTVKAEKPAKNKAIPKPEKPKEKTKMPQTAVQIAAEKIAERSLSEEKSSFDCPLAYMASVMNDGVEDPKLRLDAAKALASFTVAKPGEKGKKEERQDAAKQVASSGRFSAAAAPLRSVK